jgi:hypothetical protein
MFDKARAINSDNQLYKQAGNSVTVTVVFALGMKILEVKRKWWVMIVADKEGLIKRIDEELKMFEESVPVAKRDDIFFNDLQVKTAFRNALYNTPLTERMAGLVEKLDNILDCMFGYWTELDFETLNLERNDFYEVTHRFLEQLTMMTETVSFMKEQATNMRSFLKT